MSARAAIYLDANAGLPPLPQLTEEIRDVPPLLHNASSAHQLGRAARALTRNARKQVGDSLSSLISALRDDQWVFTSGGTEAIQGAIRAVEGPVWISQSTEHAASRAMCHRFDSRSFPLDQWGRIDVEAVPAFLESLAKEGVLNGKPFLASLIWVNNETGVIQHQIRELCTILKGAGALVLVDGAQAWGKLAPETENMLLDTSLCDFFIASGHKLGAFSGTGVLAFSVAGRKLLLKTPVFAGSQSTAIRAGTENTLGQWSLGVAAQANAWAVMPKLERLRDQLEIEVLKSIPCTRINGQGAQRVSNTLSVSFEGVKFEALSLVDRMDLEGFAVSAGSACSSGIQKPSHVLKALGHSDELALATLRISLPPDFDPSCTDTFLRALQKTVTGALK